ncbi:MAG: hypothetical protein ACE366_02855 [Bradymonadia bacterium]
MNDLLGLMLEDSPVSADSGLNRWLRPRPHIDPPEGFSDAALELARRGWLDRARAEYIGVMVARRLHGLLVDLNAPMDVQELALMMQLQEQQHTALCMACARALGADGEVAFEIDELQQARSPQPVDTQTWQMIAGTLACGEGVALALIGHAVSALPPSPFREALNGIAADESLHARLGEVLLQIMRAGQTEDWLPWPGDDVVRAFVEAYQRQMRQRAVVEPDEAAAFDDPALAAELVQLGIPPSEAFKAAYMHGVNVRIPRRFAHLGLPLSTAVEDLSVAPE